MSADTTLDRLRRGELVGATRLDLSCGLTRLPDEVFALADTLEVLNLSGNALTDLPPEMGRLKRLRIVFGSNNRFEHLPEALGECPSLEVVGFKATRIRRVDGHALPPRLRWLILTDNAIERLPDALGERPAMQKLMLAGNRLQALPEGLAQAQHLELLRLSANRLESLPHWLARLPRLAWLALAGNPLGWHTPAPAPLPQVAWSELRVRELLGEGASGVIHRVELPDGTTRALKRFKGDVTSDGLPEHEIAGSLAAGAHPALCTPVAELGGHPDRTRGILLPLLPPQMVNLAGPPSMASCTRDVYAPGFGLTAEKAWRVAGQVLAGVAHLHRKGVMHGDLYAHNVLWDPASGDAVLSDMGAACLMPADRPGLRRDLLALEVRALGVLFEELASHVIPDAVPPGEGAGLGALRQVAKACLDLDPAQRPSVAELAASWRV